MEFSFTQHGDVYLPDLCLEEEAYPIGKYGLLRKCYLKEHMGLLSSTSSCSVVPRMQEGRS